MKTRKKYEIGNWVEETEQHPCPLFDRNKAINASYDSLVKGGLEEWEERSKDLPLVRSNLWKPKVEERKPDLLESIRKTYTFVYCEVLKFLDGTDASRLNSLLRKDYAITEFIRAQPIDWTLEREASGSIKDISIDTSRGRPPGVYSSAGSTPEQALQDKEFNEQILKLLATIKASGRRHVSTYFKILEMELLDHIHVTPGCASTLGVPAKNVASMRFQAFELARKIALEQFPELIPMIDSLKRGTKHKVKKSKKIHTEGPTHGSIKIWRKGKGWKTISYEKALQISKRLKRWRKKGLLKRKPKRFLPVNPSSIEVGANSLDFPGAR